MRPAPTMQLVTHQVQRSDAAPSHEPLPNTRGVLLGPQGSARFEAPALHPEPRPTPVVPQGDATEAHSHEDAAHVMRTADVREGRE